MNRKRQLGGVRVVMRHYFSAYLLWSAEHFADEARQIEAAHEGQSRFDIEHQGYVLASILSAASFLEAVANELYGDAHDQHGVANDGYIAPLSKETQRMMAELWRGTDNGSKLRPLDKYQLLLTIAGLQPLDRGEQPYQDAQLVIQLRNAIAHFQPEDLSADWPHRMQQRLAGKFPENRLMAGAGNPWWPSHCLGHGCASWAARSALALTDRVSDQLGIQPNYMRLHKDNWAGFGKTPTDSSMSG
jgi:hypothetical protein